MAERDGEGQFVYQAWCDRCQVATTHLFGACQAASCREGFPRPASTPVRMVNMVPPKGRTA